MNFLQNEAGKKALVFLSQSDKDYLIYMCTDAWITPELKTFKNELLERVRKES